MHKILILFLLFFISCKETTHKRKVIFFTDTTFRQKKDSAFVESFSEIKQKSFVQIYDRNGDQGDNLFEQGTLNKGIKVGIWKSYFESLDQVILCEEKIYSQEGDLRNFRAYDYDTQKITEDKNYLYDHLVGIQKEFYPNGNLHISFETDEKGNYINDFIVLSKKGEEIFSSHLGTEGTGYIKYYDKDNFLIWEGAFKNKMKEGWHHQYEIDNGKKNEIESTLYQNGKTIEKYRDQERKKDSKILKLVSFSESVKQYGAPKITKEFENAKKGEVFPGIRAAIGKYYPSGEKIIIKEAIWNKNDSTEIAIWYTRKQDKWMPFGHFQYDKNTDF